MLKEQRDIYLELANDLWEQKKEVTLNLDEFNGLDYRDLITKEIGTLYYTLRFYIRRDEYVPMEIYLEGVIESSTSCIVMAYSAIPPSSTIDLQSLIKKLKDDVKERYADAKEWEAVATLSEADDEKIKELIRIVLKQNRAKAILV